MIVTKKAIQRRTILKGLGAAIGLPFLESMIPALSPLQAQSVEKPVQRFALTYVAHGYAPGYWIPATEGRDYELTQPLQSLAAFQDRVLVLSGIDSTPAVSRIGDGGGGHGRMPPAFMSGVHCKSTQGTDYQAG